MPLPDDVYRSLIEKRAAEHREAERDARLALLRVLLHVAWWTGCGLFIIGLAWHTRDEGWGRIFWYLGAAVWLAGVLTALHRARLRGEDRGDV